MLDYRGIEALHTVQELQSFEAAAKKLNITQSAISQRIKSLEIYYGEPLLIRTLPYRCTPLGSQLIGHFKRICLLEKDLEKQLGAVVKPSFSVALNRDSLETWFMDAIKTPIFQEILVEIIADDQERTVDYLKKGQVSACISTSEKEIVGGKVDFVGNMEYVLVASPEFVIRYFSEKSPESFRSAPALKFDHNDSLHERYLEKFLGLYRNNLKNRNFDKEASQNSCLEQATIVLHQSASEDKNFEKKPTPPKTDSSGYFGINAKEFDYHIVPSVKGFKQFVLLGYGYALIPKIDIVEELKKNQLVEIHPDKSWQIPLYWHYWAVESPLYRKFNEEMIRQAKRKLNYEKF